MLAVSLLLIGEDVEGVNGRGISGKSGGGVEYRRIAREVSEGLFHRLKVQALARPSWMPEQPPWPGGSRWRWKCWFWCRFDCLDASSRFDNFGLNDLAWRPS
ncbi:hypothetical protein BDU57DRAFT_533788 [Ampelomyces quisqualis]|uniref:Uncharacterized protein n=1 Tax=Ampelomyces quisqualis TaxID=50730 RepID=A0A6A5Q4I3_AMPQU|nr:hypothetical protein BDU57DRAFT_533788 [Ampelomyces quisqualis]